MDIRQLELFTAVAEERNFTRAAEVTFVTQSGMSASVRALERELGVQLFNRAAKEVTLTRAGHTFLPRARRMLEDARGAQRELLGVSGESAGTVRVGSVQCVGDLVDLVDLIASFRGSQPSVEVALVQTSSAQLADLLSRSELDVALLALAVGETLGPSARGVTTVELRRERFVLALPPHHPLAGHDVVDWDDLESLDFVDFSTAWVAREVIDAAFSARRRSRHTTMTVDDVHMLLDLVGHGLGAAILPESIASKPQAGDLALATIAAPELAWQVHLAVSGQAGSAARAFAAMLIPAVTTDNIREQMRTSAAVPS